MNTIYIYIYRKKINYLFFWLTWDWCFYPGSGDVTGWVWKRTAYGDAIRVRNSRGRTNGAKRPILQNEKSIE